jgi:hypothetical protein
MDKDLMLKLFLDTLMRFALENPNLLTANSSAAIHE